jgi:hypothetical protein
MKQKMTKFMGKGGFQGKRLGDHPGIINDNQVSRRNRIGDCDGMIRRFEKSVPIVDQHDKRFLVIGPSEEILRFGFDFGINFRYIFAPWPTPGSNNTMTSDVSSTSGFSART